MSETLQSTLQAGIYSGFRRSSPRLRRAKPVGGLFKRAFDMVCAAIAIVVLSPLFLIVGALVAISSGFPVMYSQQRVGFGGRMFRCYKFRSMVKDSDAALARHLDENPAARAEWAATQKLVNDPRVTAIGRVLRKTSLDELPQLFNIVRGDMSCVGPRPIVKDELSRYGLYAAHYQRTRPGLTGLWQVSGRSKLSYGSRVALDCLYVRRWSMRMDVVTAARTVPALLRTRETA